MNKTEVMLLRAKGKRRMKDIDIGIGVTVEGKRVELQNSIKYLGLLIKDDWSFKNHLGQVARKAEGMMVRLGRFMANKKGPSEKKRKLYSNIINSVVLYGAPIWADEVEQMPKIAQPIRSVQRRVSLRVLRAYKSLYGDSISYGEKSPSGTYGGANEKNI